jgi:hypothetical protein
MPNVSKKLFDEMFFKVKREYESAKYKVKGLKQTRKDTHRQLIGLKKRFRILRYVVTKTGNEFKKAELSVVAKEYDQARYAYNRCNEALPYARRLLEREYKLFCVAKVHVKD